MKLSAIFILKNDNYSINQTLCTLLDKLLIEDSTGL